MKDFLTQRFLETYAPHGLDIYADEVHEPQLDRVHRKRVTDWREMILLFLSITSFRHSKNHTHADQPFTTWQLLKDAQLNLMGYEDSGPRWWRVINTLLAIPTLLYHIAVIPFHIMMNAIKFFTEFLPRVATVLLFRLADHLAYQPQLGVLSRVCLYALSLLVGSLACGFSTIRFISRALTSPLDGIYVGWRIGNALGGTQLGTDKEGHCELSYTTPGKLIGGALAGLSALMTLSAFIIALPLILFHLEIFPPDWVGEYIPGFIFKMMGLINPVLDTFAYFLGWDRVIAILHLDKEMTTTEFCFMRLLEPIAHELISPHVRSKLKNILVILVSGISSLLSTATCAAKNGSVTFVPTVASLLRGELAMQAAAPLSTPISYKAAAIVKCSTRLFSAPRSRVDNDKLIAAQPHDYGISTHCCKNRREGRVSL